MPENDLAQTYGAYIACLNGRRWDDLGRFVHGEIAHNGAALGLPGYRALLERDVREIPDLRFEVGLLVCEPPHVAARLLFDCHPAGAFLGLEVGGRRVRFPENVFYRFEEGRIREVWSVVDRAAIEAQLRR